MKEGSMDLYKKLLKNKIIVPEEDLLSIDEPPTEFLSSGIVMFNTACSGSIHGAFAVGKITLFSAHSMLGKTIIGMVAIRDAQRKGMFCVVLDAEFQWDWNLATKIGIENDPEKIIVIPNNRLEEVQEKVMQITEGLTKEERKKVFFMLDSWGSLVTTEGLKKAADAEAKKDFVITQKKNNFANMIMSTRCTFYITNGVYDNVGGFGDLLKIPGGKRIILNAHTVILGQSKAKDKAKTSSEDVLNGAIISCQVYKSRFSREKTTFKFRIKYDGGLDIFYGILDDAVAGGYIKDEGTHYTRTHIKGDQKWKEKNLYTSAFWTPIFNDTDFNDYLQKQYTFQGNFDVNNETFYSDVSGNKEKPTEKPSKN